jgi:hypothetical protein
MAIEQPSMIRQETSTLQPLDDPAARTLLAAAYARMYKWPPGFAGYRAQLSVNNDGHPYDGTVTVIPQQQPRVEVTGNENLRAWVRERLWTQTMHLVDIPFHAGDGRYAITFMNDTHAVCDHPRGPCVRLSGGPLPSWYRIEKERYTQIGCTPPCGLRWVNTIERYDTAPNGYLYATHYVLAFFAQNPDALVGIESCTNEYTACNGILLPAWRRITTITNGKVQTRTIRLTDHRLLPSTAQTKE